MLKAGDLFVALRENGINFFSGVPDSLLKDFCAYLSSHTTETEHVIAANEGNAVAIVAGHFIATGSSGLVYMQNSGIGNAVNPLTSLVDVEVYSIPMLLLIGWRGEPGSKDEPQHVKQGRIMTGLLNVLEIPYFLLDSSTSSIFSVVSCAAQRMREMNGPVALLVRKDTFDSYKFNCVSEFNFELTREDAIRCVVDLLNETDIIVATTGMTSRELYEYRVMSHTRHDRDFLTVGSMGHTASIALGLARGQPERRVFCFDGDGSLIMHMGAMGIIGQSKQRNFVHIVLNNGAHDSVGGQPTVGFAVDFGGIAKACGYQSVGTARSQSEIRNEIMKSTRAVGPSFLEIRVNKGARPNLGRPKSSPIENRLALMTRLRGE